jgi:hypothetical protein
MAYISTVDVSFIRKELKQTFGKAIKFSVTRDHHSGVSIKIMKSKEDMSPLFGDNVTKHSGSVSPHWMDDTPVLKTLFEKIEEIALTAPAKNGGREWFDKSDAMVDYFHTAYYCNIGVGKWDKGWEMLK